MSEALSAGTVSIGVKPDTTGFTSTLKSGILGGTAGVGEGMGSMILGGLKTMAGPIMAVTAAFSVKHILEDSMHAFEDLAGQVKGMQRVMGGTTEQVSGLRGALQLAGVNTDTVGGAMTIFSKKLGMAAEDGTKAAAMAKLLGENFKDAHGNVKPLSDLMPGLADKFEAMPNGAEKTALAMQLFGRQGATLIPFLNKGSAGIADLTAQAQKMGLTLDDTSMKSFAESKKSARDFAAAIQGLKVTLGGELVPVIDAVQNIFRNALSPVIQSVTGFLASHREMFMKLAETIEGFGKTANGALGSFFKSVGAQLQALGPVFSQLAPQIMQLLSAFSPMGLAFKALMPVLPALIDSVVKLAVSIGGSLAAVLKEILPPITQVANILVGALSGVFQQLMPAITQLATLLGNTLGDVIKQLAPVVVVLVQAVASLIPPLIPLITQIIQLAISAIMPLAKAILPLIEVLLPPLVSLIQFLTPIITFLAKVVESILVVAIQIAINVLKVIITWVTNTVTWFSNLVKSVVDTGKNIGDWFRDLPNMIGSFMRDAGNWLLEAGKNLIQGLINGAGSMGSAVMDWVHGLGNNIVNGFKSMLGIHSPSTVFHDFGLNIGEGLTNGLQEAIPQITTVMGAMGNAVKGQMDTIVKGVSGNLVNVSALTAQFNQSVSNLQDAGLMNYDAIKAANKATPGGSLQAQLDNALGQATFTSKATGMSTTFSSLNDMTPEFYNSQVAPLLANGYRQTSGQAFTAPAGVTIVYNAAPNQSLDSAQALQAAVQRARILNQW
jgi:phage-related protein